jgi:hypothetical protein
VAMSKVEFLGSDGFVRLEEAPSVRHDLVDATSSSWMRTGPRS